jgi:hypothetical protein
MNSHKNQLRRRTAQSRIMPCALGYLHTGDLRAVQEFLDHVGPRVTARYAHVVDMAKKSPALFIPVKAG